MLPKLGSPSLMPRFHIYAVHPPNFRAIAEQDLELLRIGETIFLRDPTIQKHDVSTYDAISVGYDHHSPIQRWFFHLANVLLGIRQLLSWRRKSLRSSRNGHLVLVSVRSPLINGNPNYVC